MNVIEIVVKGTNGLKPALEEAKRDGRQVGQEVGREFSKGIEDKIEDAVPPVVQDSFKKTKEPARKTGTETGAAFTQAINQEMTARLSAISSGQGAFAGASFSSKFSEGAKVGLTRSNLIAALGPQLEALARPAGQDVGAGLGEGISKGVDPGLEDLDGKIKGKTKKTGQDAGADAGAGFMANASPLMLGAFAAAATVGPGLILTATAAAVVGAGALITKGNAALLPSYQALGQQASTAIADATSPLISDLHASIDILRQGIPQLGGDLKQAFAAAAPAAEDITHGMLNLADNTLPGITAGLRAIQPYSGQIAADFGKLGSGLGGLFSGLAGGASGGMQGFNALIDMSSRLLTSVGQITGALANGLGPALHDIDTVAGPVVTALGDVATVLPPGAIRAAGDAVAFLFAAFEVGKLAGITQEGQTFLQFLGLAKTETEAAAAATVTLGAAEEATAAKAGLMATASAAGTAAVGALGSAASAAVGPYGLLAAALLVAQNQITKYTGIQLDPIGAYKQWDKAENSHITIMGESARATAGTAQTVAQYAKLAAAGVQSVAALSGALSTAGSSAQDNAQKTAAATLAALGARDGQDQLTVALNGTLVAFEEDSGKATAFKTALDALYGKYQSYSDAQAQFTTDLDAASKALTRGKDAVDFYTVAGATNERILSGLATDAKNRAQALLNETGNQDLANKALQDGVRALDATARQAHFTQGQIDALNVALFGTKKIGDIKVTVGADTSAVYAGVSRAVNWINGQYASIGVSVRGPLGTGQAVAAFAHGGVVASDASAPIGTAAVGGPRGNLTWMNEQGPELVRLPSGSTVFSNPDTMRMMSEARSAPVHVTLEMSGSADPVLNALWTELRHHIRVRYGSDPNSVQKALGQSF